MADAGEDFALGEVVVGKDFVVGHPDFSFGAMHGAAATATCFAAEGNGEAMGTGCLEDCLGVGDRERMLVTFPVEGDQMSFFIRWLETRSRSAGVEELTADLGAVIACFFKADDDHAHIGERSAGVEELFAFVF